MRKGLLGLFLFIFTLQLFAEDVKSVSYETQKKFDYFYLEALRLKENNRATEAFQTLEHALSIYPHSAAGLYEISNFYFILGLDSLARQALESAVSYEPDNSEYKLTLASLCKEMGQLEKSAALYEELIRDNPKNTNLNFNLIDLYIRLQNPEAAIRALDNAERDWGMREIFSLQKYSLYSQSGQEEKGIEELIKLTEKFPYESRYLYILGDVYLKQNNPDKALEYYTKAYHVDPLDPLYAVSMVSYYRYKNDNEAINKLFSDLIEQHSQEVEFNRLYGNFLLSQKRLEEAKFQFRVVTEMAPEDYDAWRNLLSIALTDNNTEEIISICDDALVHFPDIPEFYFYKGIALYQEESYQEALSVYQDGLQYTSNMNRAIISSFYGQIGDVQLKVGDKEAAYEAYDKALEYNPNNILILNNYAYFLSIDKQNLDKAESMSAKTIQAESNNPTYLDTYAWVFFQKGDYTLAKFYIEYAISQGGGNSPEIVEHYGDILHKTGNTEQAVKEWEKALNLYGEEEDTSLLKRKISNKAYEESK